MATLMKWKIDPTIGMIGPKIKALAFTGKILWLYIYFLVIADIGHYGNLIMKWKIDPTIGMIGPKIKALALTVEILWPYI